MSIYIQVQIQRNNRKVSKIQDIVINTTEKCWLLQIYCNPIHGLQSYTELLWRLLTSSSADREKCDVRVYTWKDYGDKFFDAILRRHPSATMIISVKAYCGNGVIKVEDGERQWSNEITWFKEFICFFQNALNKTNL